MFTVTQTAKVASKIIPKTTQDGIIPPRRRTSVRVPRISTESCCTEAREFVRGVTRCALIRSSPQYVFATLLTSHLRSSFAVQNLLSSYFPAPCQRGKGEGYASGACHPCPRADCLGSKVKRLLNRILWVWPQYSRYLVTSSPN